MLQLYSNQRLDDRSSILDDVMRGLVLVLLGLADL